MIKNKLNITKLDSLGIGEVSKNIPKEVYIETTKSLVSRFNEIISPITETTSGLGRYIKQKFDNKVELEKAVGALTIENAIIKARNKGKLISPRHIKSFVTSLDEASKEIDVELHQMWENLISSQITESEFHPHFVKVLSYFSPSEANLLKSLHSSSEIGKDVSSYFSSPYEFKNYVFHDSDFSFKKWSYSCNLLIELGFARVVAPTKNEFKKEKSITLLYRTSSGDNFLNLVSDKK
ncbi:Abi-alpha family protein [Wenyingzhuangia sp. IMCC45574]